MQLSQNPSNSATKSSSLVRLDCREVLLGMYICELDCPWSDTPFSPGGFHLRKADELQLLQKFCKTVTIDTNKGAEPARRKRTDLTILSSARRSAPEVASLKVQRDTYPISQPVKKILDSSVSAYESLQTEFHRMAQAVREGQRLDLDAIEPLRKSVIDSLLANPQALIWTLLTDVKPRFNTSYSVRATVWACMLARQIGLKRSEIEVLFLGTLLSDIGMHLRPERLVNKRKHFRKKEFLAYRKHIEFGLDFLNQYPELDERILRIVRCHHERHDGRGFPRGIRGDQIPSLARYASLAYCFERLLRTHCETGKISPAKAIARLYKQRLLKFPEQLIVEFIHVMGMYPVGTVVELSSGELALILEQNESQRLFPKVAMITDANRKLLKTANEFDLSKQTGTSNLSIIKGVDPEEFAVDLSAYRTQFFGKRVGIGPLSFRL